MAHSLVSGSVRGLQRSTMARWGELVRQRKATRRKVEMLSAMASRTERGMVATAYRRWNMFAAVQAERSRHRATAQVAAYHFAVRTTSSARMRQAFVSWMRFLRGRRVLASQLQGVRALGYVASVRLSLRTFAVWRQFVSLRSISSSEVSQRLLFMKRDCRHRLCARYLSKWMEFAWARRGTQVQLLQKLLQVEQQHVATMDRQHCAWRLAAKNLLSVFGSQERPFDGSNDVVQVMINRNRELLPNEFLALALALWNARWTAVARKLYSELATLRTCEKALRESVKSTMGAMKQHLQRVSVQVLASVERGIEDIHGSNVESLENLRNETLLQIQELEMNVHGKEQLAHMCERLMEDVGHMRHSHLSLTKTLNDRDSELDYARVQLLSTRAELERVRASGHSYYDQSEERFLKDDNPFGASSTAAAAWYADVLCRVVGRLLQAMATLERDTLVSHLPPLLHSGRSSDADAATTFHSSHAVGEFLAVVRREFTELTTLSNTISPQSKKKTKWNPPTPPPPPAIYSMGHTPSRASHILEYSPPTSPVQLSSVAVYSTQYRESETLY